MSELSQNNLLLTTVRRFEAAGFRAWPATSVHFDGTWAIRLTASNPAKRLNSVNPLDPGDANSLSARIERAAQRFAAYDRPLTFRVSPLAGRRLQKHLDDQGWTRFDESLVMKVDLQSLSFAGILDHIPIRDVARFSSAHLAVRELPSSARAGVSEVVNAIEPEAGLFIFETNEQPVATTICVHDGELAGLFEIATNAAFRRQGHGRNAILSALKWARFRGAKSGWLQVEESNVEAVALYRSLGFEDVYRYHYRRPSDDA